MGGDSALTLLREEFADNDLIAKRRAAERLDLVAKALGQERARKDLIPWMLENLQQEDEVLFLFAKGCSKLVELIGGVDHSECILPVLEALLEVEETFVRDAAVECCLGMIGETKNEAIAEKWIEMIIRLSKKEWFTGRISACALCGSVMQIGLKEDNGKKLKEAFYALCKDETPMVRRGASKEIGKMVESMDPASIENEIVPLLEKLSGDAQESVALNWIGNLGNISARLSAEQNMKHTLHSVTRFGQDRSWRVRFTVAKSFDKLCQGMGKENTQTKLLPLYCELLRDAEGEVRNEASNHLTCVCKTIGGEMFVEQVIPVIVNLVEYDQQRVVRLNIAKASVSEGLVNTLGAALAKENLVTLWETFLRDSQSSCVPEVRLIVLNGLDKVIEAIGGSTVVQTWTPLLQELFETSRHHNGGTNEQLINPNNINGVGEEIEHPQWRLRVAIIHALGKLAAVGESSIDKLLVDTWYSALQDEVFEVRMTAARILDDFCQANSSVGPNKVSTMFVPKLAECFKVAKSNYSQRVIFVHAFASLLKNGQGLADPLFPSFESCLDDKVANVRLAAILSLEALDDLGAAFKEKFAKQLQGMMTDPDVDVSEAAKALQGRMLL